METPGKIGISSEVSSLDGLDRQSRFDLGSQWLWRPQKVAYQFCTSRFQELFVAIPRSPESLAQGFLRGMHHDLFADRHGTAHPLVDIGEYRYP